MFVDNGADSVRTDGAGSVMDGAGIVTDGAGVDTDGAGVDTDGAGVVTDGAGVVTDGTGVENANAILAVELVVHAVATVRGFLKKSNILAWLYRFIPS